jgi:hypothetical protein
MGDMNGSKAAFEEIRGLQRQQGVAGDKIVTERVDNLGYGISASTPTP